MKKIINKLESGYRLVSMGLLVLIASGVAYVAVAVVSRTPGKISEYIPPENYPTQDKGYIGHPTDAVLNQAEEIKNDDSLFSMLGKTWYQNSQGGSVSPCGYCQQAYSHEHGSINPFAIGCCTTTSSHCIPKNGYKMFINGGDSVWGSIGVLCVKP